MRTDRNLAAEQSVLASREWQRAGFDGPVAPEVDLRLQQGDELVDGKLAVHSLSGHERNHMFLNRGAGEEFIDLSGPSGMDSESDSRSFALLDYDRDGWQDVALVNANQPLTQLYHNDIAQVPGVRGGMIAIRFVGGNTAAAASELSNRDGYGAIVEVGLSGGVRLKREHRCGEGYAAQNSSTMIIGIGDRSSVESVGVRWPSGKRFSVESVPEGTLVTAFENRAEGAFTQQPYRSATKRSGAEQVELERPKFPLARSSAGEQLQIYTTTATWCAACLEHLPALAQLEQEGVGLYGVPIDPDDDATKLAEYVEKRKPPYQMLAEIGAREKQAVSEFLAQELQMQNPLLPSSVITDGDGNVLEVMQGIPTLSQLRKWRQ